VLRLSTFDRSSLYFFFLSPLFYLLSLRAQTRALPFCDTHKRLRQRAQTFRVAGGIVGAITFVIVFSIEDAGHFSVPGLLALLVAAGLWVGGHLIEGELCQYPGVDYIDRSGVWLLPGPGFRAWAKDHIPTKAPTRLDDLLKE